MELGMKREVRLRLLCVACRDREQTADTEELHSPNTPSLMAQILQECLCVCVCECAYLYVGV